MDSTSQCECFTFLAGKTLCCTVVASHALIVRIAESDTCLACFPSGQALLHIFKGLRKLQTKTSARLGHIEVELSK
jgi:hypothetical protein